MVLNSSWPSVSWCFLGCDLEAYPGQYSQCLMEMLSSYPRESSLISRGPKKEPPTLTRALSSLFKSWLRIYTSWSSPIFFFPTPSLPLPTFLPNFMCSLFLFNPYSPLCAANVCLGVSSPAGAWVAPQGLCWDFVWLTFVHVLTAAVSSYVQLPCGTQKTLFICSPPLPLVLRVFLSSLLWNDSVICVSHLGLSNLPFLILCRLWVS